jgi:hypothetical protein
MFNSFFNNADLLALVLLCYAEAVAFFVAAANRDNVSARLTQPSIVTSFFASIYVFAAIPLLFIGGFYIGGYSGFLGGVIGFFGLAIVSSLIAAIFSVKNNLGIHLLIAPIALIYSYIKITSTWS